MKRMLGIAILLNLLLVFACFGMYHIVKIVMKTKENTILCSDRQGEPVEVDRTIYSADN